MLSAKPISEQAIMDNLRVFVVFGNCKFSFPSLIESLDSLKHLSKVTIQSGYSEVGSSLPKNWKIFDFCPSDRFSQLISESDIVVAHAGVGVITSCLEHGKRAIVIPRQASSGEHINNHQVLFAEYYSKEGLFEIFKTPMELSKSIMLESYKKPPSRSFITNLEGLKNDLQSFIESTLDVF
jgi:UDP-N-acetylglucosamine transferase subunit ALG13